MALELEPTGNAGNLYFKLCSDHLSIEAIPRKATRLDLTRLKREVPSGVDVMFWTPQFVVLRNVEGHEITLRRDGRMIIRKAPSQEAAERSASQIMNVLSGLAHFRS